MASIGLHRSRQAPAENTPSFGSIAERFRRAGDLDRAIALCQEGLKKFPHQLSARVTLGWAFLDKGEYDLARQELERVIRRAPDNLAAIRGLAELHDRAEHAVTGLGPDGMWTPSEELTEDVGQHAATAAVEPSIPAVEVREAAVASFSEPDGPVLATPLLAPLPVSHVALDDVDPRSLIETPAEAAVARSSHNTLPAASVFEEIVEGPEGQASVEVAELVTASAAMVEAELPRKDPRPTTVDHVVSWDAAGEPQTPDRFDASPVLLAEDAEIELSRMASELADDGTDPALDMVIDLPTAEGSLENAFLQFEDAAEVDSPPEGVTFLDVQETLADEVAIEPSLAGVVAEFSVPDSPMLESAPASSSDLAPQALAPQDADLAHELEAARVPDVPIGSEDSESPLAAEVAAQVEILPPIDLPEAVGLGTPIVDGLAADVARSAPVGAEPPIVGLVETPFSAAAEVPVVADEAPPFGIAEEIVVAAAAEDRFEDSVPATAEASVLAADEAPLVDVSAAEAIDEREMPAVATAEPGQFSDTAEPPGLGDAEEQRAAVDLPAVDLPSVAVVGEADRVAPTEAADQDAPSVAPAFDFQAGPWVNAGVAAVPDASGPDAAAPVVSEPEDTADVPEVSWEPEPAPVEEDEVEVPALAAAMAHVSDADAELLAPRASVRRSAGRDAAPIAALEAFLKKISARRLHLTPGSVA